MSGSNIGELEKELELEYYAVVDSLDQIKAMATSSENQYQATIFKGRDNIRVRNTDGKCVLTTKTASENLGGGRTECNLDVTEDFFHEFVKMADRCVEKTRYFIPREDGLVWEVDVFKTRKGTESLAVKVDLEYKDQMDFPDLPFDTIHTIDNQYGDRTELEIEFITKCFEERWSLK